MTTTTTRRQALGLLAAAPLAAPALVQAQGAPIKIGMSGWTGFAPLTLADKGGLFRKHGVNVETVFIPQAQRLAALVLARRRASSRPCRRWRQRWIPRSSGQPRCR